jgi:UDP-N-acetyl-D-galactosamine dehydrogenase
MVQGSLKDTTVCVVGLGYVGYPLADAFSRHLTTIGYDLDTKKIARINAEPGNKVLATTDPARIREADVVIIAVPTPVTKAKDPDISYVVSAAGTVGRNLKDGAIVVLESTVYPGLTEEIMVPTLEEASGRTCGKDFSVGYSPERINPGDVDHVLEKITKIVSGMDAATTEAPRRPLRPRDQRLRRPRHPDRRGGEGDRERPAGHQYCSRERALDHLPEDGA